MKKIKGLLAIVASGMLALASCGSDSKSSTEALESSEATVTYEDGTYRGKSSTYGTDDDVDSGYGIVTFTISGGVITECTFQTYKLDGTLKDESYYNNAELDSNQKRNAKTAVEACVEYANALIAAQNISDVDCIAGATINFNQFVNAVEKALKAGPVYTE
ncbi:MAG: FMN-binding protein [Acholeplasmatales bacterium]|nr:FMN-binding protein [Acholeplasmatales bacterium]